MSKYEAAALTPCLEDEPWRVDDGEIGAEGVLRAQHDGLGRHSAPHLAKVRLGHLPDGLCDRGLWVDGRAKLLGVLRLEPAAWRVCRGIVHHHDYQRPVQQREHCQATSLDGVMDCAETFLRRV